MLNRDEVLKLTGNGLDIFKHYVPGNWRVGRNFLNPLYEDRKASCNIYFDRRHGCYRMKDFGNDAYMARELKMMLSGDFAKNMNKNLYEENLIQTHHIGRQVEHDQPNLETYIDPSGRRQVEGQPLQAVSVDEFTEEDYKEIDEILAAIKAGKWEEYNERNNPALNAEIKAEEKPTIRTHEPKPAVNIEEQPVMTLYDLFGFTEQERKQLSTNKRGKKKSKTTDHSRQPDLFSGPQVRPAKQNTAIVYPVFNARNEELQKQLRALEEPRPYSGVLSEHHRQGSLVVEQNGQTGFLKERYRDKASFKSLELNPLQKAKADLYVSLRDRYHDLYRYEATQMNENPELRQSLNDIYDMFVKRYGNLNDKKNVDLIKMDAGGTEMLSLERYTDGKAVKADIFNQPVAFNSGRIKQADTPLEALSASLNRFGEVNTEYMLSLLPEKSIEEMLEDLHGRIYYNPLAGGYETSDRFIAGNVIEKAEGIGKYMERHPQDEHAGEIAESLKAIREAVPRPIGFEELDFNFGERWIPSGIYSGYAEYMFNVKTVVHYAPNSDEYSVKANYRTIDITHKYAVQGEFRTYDGVSLIKHALHNTTPNISKSAKATDKEGKVVTLKEFYD
jgi:hypothetical protein